jgi:ribonuclease P protein subunit RPR2
MSRERKHGRQGIRTHAMTNTARRRIDTLLDLAREMARKNDVQYMRRYVQLAWKLSTRYNVRIPRERKRWICKTCFAYLLPGVTARVRIKGQTKVTCLLCGAVKRYSLRRTD